MFHGIDAWKEEKEEKYRYSWIKIFIVEELFSL